MSEYLLMVVFAIYVWVACEHAYHGRWPMFLIYIAYAISLAGFIWEEHAIKERSAKKD